MGERLNWLERGVALAFRLYPRSFRQEFEHEMRSVYLMAAQEARRGGISSLLRFSIHELYGVLAGAMSEYRKLVCDEGGGQMSAFEKNNANPRNDPGSLPGDSHSTGTLLVGSAIFLLWGLEAIINEIAFSSKEPRATAFITAGYFLSWLLFLLPPVVVGYAFTRNFPRWTYPYVGSALLYTYFMAAKLIATPQAVLLGRISGSYTPIGWRAWLPLILAMGIALLITRSLTPLRRFLTNAWIDWTLLSYAMFGWVPLFLMASFDEVASGYTLAFLPLVMVTIVLTALLYLASRTLAQRAWLLFTGAFLSLAITLVANEVYWSGIAAFNGLRTGLILTVFLGVLFSPALIGVWRHFQRHDLLHQA